MAANANKYIIYFNADTKQFEYHIKNAGQSYNKFNESVKKDSENVGNYFKDLTKKLGVAVGAFKGLETAFNIVKDTMNASASGQERLVSLTAQVSTGYQTLQKHIYDAAFGTGNFNLTISESINLAKKFQEELRKYKSLDFSTQIRNSALDMKIAMLEAQKFKGANTVEIDVEIKAAKTEKMKSFNQLGNEAGKLFLNKFNAFLGSNINKISSAVKIFDPSEAVYIENIKKAYDVINKKHEIRGRAIQSENDELQRQTGFIKALSADPEFGKILKDISELTDEQLEELKKYYLNYNKYHKEAFDLQKDLNTEKDNELKKSNDVLKTKKETLAVDEKRIKAIKHINSIMPAGSTDYSKTEAFKLIETAVKNPGQQLKAPEMPKLSGTFNHQPYVSDEEVQKFNNILEAQKQLAFAIDVNTQLFGAQSEQVKYLQEMYEKLTPTDRWEEFAQGIQGVSAAFDTFANSSDKIKDNPAIKALATSMMILNAVTSLKATSSPWEFVAAALAVAATTISFITSLSSQKFAIGGIVSPALTGDQTQIRVNAGEMILNNNQQKRLFNMIAREPEKENNLG